MTSTVPSFLRSTPTPPKLRAARVNTDAADQPLLLNFRMRADLAAADLSEAHDRIDRLFASL